jgi:uncharacterized protein with NAD-binding domain and iron-sulfur cluster
MSHLLPRESWSCSERPQSIAYFCGTMAPLDPLPRDPVGDARQRAEAAAANWQKNNLATLWPAAADPGQPPRAGVVLSSYYRANVDPSELYVQTPPGSVKHRLASDTPVCRNLYVAGDWTSTRFNGGCGEAAIESAMLAARAIGGEPAEIAGH